MSAQVITLCRLAGVQQDGLRPSTMPPAGGALSAPARRSAARGRYAWMTPLALAYHQATPGAADLAAALDGAMSIRVGNTRVRPCRVAGAAAANDPQGAAVESDMKGA